MRVSVSIRQLTGYGSEYCLYSPPWGGTKGSWLCLMNSIIIWSPLTVSPCFCMFSFVWLNLFFDWSFFTDKRQTGDMEGKITGSCCFILSRMSHRTRDKIKSCLCVSRSWTLNETYYLPFNSICRFSDWKTIPEIFINMEEKNSKKRRTWYI